MVVPDLVLGGESTGGVVAESAARAALLTQKDARAALIVMNDLIVTMFSPAPQFLANTMKA